MRLFIIIPLILHLSSSYHLLSFSARRSLQLPRSIDEWHCGIGFFSHRIAYGLTYFSDQRGINRCCAQHDGDVQWGRDYYSRRDADYRFCSCLDNIGSFYVRWFIKPIFCGITRVYSLFQ